jgi:hypothetical protein
MTCSRCRKSFDEEAARCPHCGESAPGPSGLFQTSTVLISSGGADLVYRSVDEVPARLRTRLLQSTSGGDSATILIADRRGRKQIAKAMGRLPGSASRWLAQSILSAQAGTSPLGWLTPGRKNRIVAVVALLALAVIALVFTHRWR